MSYDGEETRSLSHGKIPDLQLPINYIKHITSVGPRLGRKSIHLSNHIVNSSKSTIVYRSNTRVELSA